MAVYFLHLETFSRAKGSSAVSLAAYRSRERIRDERTGRTYDHSQRQDVMHKEVLVPSQFAASSMSWAKDRAYLWNAAERAESRQNARVAREYLVALPRELDPEQRLKLVRGFSQELVDRYQFALDLAIHEPRDFPGSDPRNFHAHLLATTRAATPSGLTTKTELEMHDRRRYAVGLKPSVHELLFVRERWASVANEALREAHVDARIDHRSLAAQGIDREPYPHIPRAAFEMERHGYRSFVAERLRAQYQERVDARIARSAERGNVPEQRQVRDRSAVPNESAAPSRVVPAPPFDDIARQSAANWRKYRETHPQQTAEEARRQAVKNWLQQRGVSAETPPPSAGRSRDDDYSL